MEVAPGIHRIESVLGPRPFSQYLLRDERSLLVDTGVKETPAEVILPFLDGLQPDFVLNSHADVDHYGGNAAIRKAAPEALFLAHALDVPWIESAEAIMREHQVRRLPVLGFEDRVVGILSLSDIAREAERRKGQRSKDLSPDAIRSTLVAVGHVRTKVDIPEI